MGADGILRWLERNAIHNDIIHGIPIVPPAKRISLSLAQNALLLHSLLALAVEYLDSGLMR